MYPNPQDALPLPARPNVDQYKKLAKDLVKACKSGDPTATRLWSIRWVRSVAALQHEPGALERENEITDRARSVERFARERMSGGGGSCAVTAAQFVIARAHGFTSWPTLVNHIESLGLEDSSISAFERGALAVVRGDRGALERLLRDHPGLIRARSTREHRATLLHYVSANGVENYRQVSPENSAEITELLLDAGADVDAEADVYESGCTALGLVATSQPPSVSGVQLQVIDVLLDHGAQMDRPGLAGRRTALVHACLANGQPKAAEHLAGRGAALDLAGAAGLGRIDVLRGYFADDGSLKPSVTNTELKDGFALACAYGRADAVAFLLEHRIDVDTKLRRHGEGHTGLHVAAFHGHLETVSVLLKHGASVDPIDKTWGTSPLVWAVTGWSRKTGPAEGYYDVVARLVAAGARVKPDLLDWNEAKADPKMFAALTGRRKV